MDHYLQVKAEVVTGGEQMDENTKATKLSVSVDKRSYPIYPWGKNNKLPNEMIELLRSNADMGNLLDTRADFLYGSGIGLFRRFSNGKELVLEPYWTADSFSFLLENGVDELVDSAILNLVQLNNAFVNVSNGSKGEMRLRCLDSTTVRAVDIGTKPGQVENYILSGRWEQDGGKYGLVVPRFDYATPDKLPESIVHLRPRQPGQFYYSYAIWWALKIWIKVVNRIAPYYDEALETEGSLGNIIHIAKKYFDDILAQNPVKEDGTPYTYEELTDAFNDTIDKLVFGGGKRMNVTDICAYDTINGKLVKLMEIEPVKRVITGNEYKETYTNGILAMSNGSKVLSGLANISDGKMNSGGGTEIRISAEYQQFYRTPRERRLILELLNRLLLPYARKKLSLPDDVFFDFKNILLETLDKNKAGAAEKKTNDV